MRSSILAAAVDACQTLRLPLRVSHLRYIAAMVAKEVRARGIACRRKWIGSQKDRDRCWRVLDHITEHLKARNAGQGPVRVPERLLAEMATFAAVSLRLARRDGLLNG